MPGLPIAVTMGDPAGVGPALISAARRDQKKRNLPEFLVFEEPLTESPIPGFPNPKHAKAVQLSIKKAVAAVFEGKARAVVTCPIHKKSLMEAGFKHAGHTGLLGELAKSTPVMMLANNELRVVPVTVHHALRDVPKVLTKKLIIETARIVAGDLEKRFGFSCPRLAVTGLNPHAGEEGKLGNEEKKTIIPAIEELQKEGIFIEGPFPADTAFTESMRMKFDAFLAMTHDQALIPVKTLNFRETVNITLGLPFIRTSPAHGTAFDLVREGRFPDPESFYQALLMADRLSG